MVALSKDYYCIAIDLKGYGQSTKQAGQYQHEGVSEQMYAMLKQIGLDKFYFATHDRGTVQADFITANHPESVLGYARGEQHLYHFNPLLSPQGELFMNAPYSGMMEDPRHFVVYVYTWITSEPISDEIMERVIQEFSYPGTTHAVPRYFNSSTFRQEWVERRNRLLAAWKCPVVIMEGYESKTQPREFYEKSRQYIPNAKAVDVRYMQGGHFWTLEDEDGTTNAIKRMLELAEKS